MTLHRFIGYRLIGRRFIVGLGWLATLLLMPESMGEGVPSPEVRPLEARPAEVRPPAARSLEADRQQLRQVMIETGIVTDPPRPGLTLWLRDITAAFSRWLADRMASVLPRLAQRVVPFFEPILILLLGFLTVVLFAFLVRFAFDRRQRRAPSPDPTAILPAAEATPARDWEAELRRRLAGGDVVAAIEALWWWLASGLVGEQAEPSWTSRELVVKAGRRDLLADVRRLDRMMYGTARPSADDVDRLWSDLRGLVG